MKHYLKALRHYADFSGRARRKEYWMFVLFMVIFYFAWGFLLWGTFFIAHNDVNFDDIIRLSVIIPFTYSIMMMLPSMAVAVRRLHDVGKSGWMLLLGLIPIVGAIWLLVLMCTDSQQGKNQYGANPKTTPETFSDKAKLTSAGVVLIVASAFAILIQIFQSVYLHIQHGIPFVTLSDIIFVAEAVILLVAGILLLHEKAMYNMREKGKYALILLLTSVSISLIMTIYYLPSVISNIQYLGWNAVIGSVIIIFCYLSMVLLVSSVLFFNQNKNLIRNLSVTAIIFLTVSILWRIYFVQAVITKTNGDMQISNLFGLYYILTSIAFIVLAGIYLSKTNPPAVNSFQKTADRNENLSAVPPINSISPTNANIAGGENKNFASSSDKQIFTLPPSMTLASWASEQDTVDLLRAIKTTWHVDCQIFTISVDDSNALESAFPVKQVSQVISGQNIPYIIELSQNSIFTHEYGSWIDFGYVKFIYKNSLYYVNAAPMVELRHDLYNRMDLLCHFAKIMICLNKKIGSDRKTLLITLDGDISQ
jgi:uncharacterized membrane protein YhaH (DUF805 family)